MKRVFVFCLTLTVLSGFVVTEEAMAYCTIDDLNETYGAERITNWSRLDGGAVDKAIENASAEIDGYLASGGYAIPVAGPPKVVKMYCIDIASANLIISAGVLENDSGGQAIIDKADIARAF